MTRTFLFRCFILISVPFFLTACFSEVESVCGKSGGECCALSFTTDVNGNPTAPSWYRCVQDGKCPPEDMAGRTSYPTFPVKDPAEGKCEAKWKNASLLKLEGTAGDLAIAGVAQFQTAAKSLYNEAKRENGGLINENDPDYCLAQCNTSDDRSRAIFCQSAVVPNDVSLALLKLTARIVQAPPKGNLSIPIKTVLADFQVSPDALTTCPRSDVTITEGTLINQGFSECRSTVSVRNSANKITAALVTPYELRADIASVPGIATFPSVEHSFVVDWTGPIAKSYYSGPITTAAESRKTDVAVSIKGQNGMRCAAVEPEVMDRTAVRSKINIANSNAGILTRLTADLKKLPVADLSTQSHQRSISFFPLSTALNSSNGRSLEAKTYEGAGPEKGSKLSARDVAMLVDISRCGEFVRRSMGDSYMQILGELNQNSFNQFDAERNRKAGEILLCVHASKLLNSQWNAAVAANFGRLP